MQRLRIQGSKSFPQRLIDRGLNTRRTVTATRLTWPECRIKMNADDVAVPSSHRRHQIFDLFVDVVCRRKGRQQVDPLDKVNLYLWKVWLPTIIFGISLSLGWVFGGKPQLLDSAALIALFTSKIFTLLNCDLPYLAHMWMEKQICSLALFKGNYVLFQFELRDARTILWQSLILFFFGTCEVSVVIPTLNEGKYVSKCLDSLRRQDFDGGFEVIVVDGGSRDGTLDLAKLIADKVIVCEGRPVGDARNLGAKLAEAEMVAFIDADTVASHRWLSSIRSSLSRPGVVGVAGPTLPYGGSALDVLAYKVATGWLQRFSMVFGLPHVAGFNCAYRRRPFLECGGFEEGRTLSEDLALSLKIRHEGRLLFNKRMVAYTSTRRVRKYGYVRLAMFYLLNDAIFALTRRSLYYPQVR